MTSKAINVGEEGALPEVVPDRSATLAALDALKKARPERVELIVFVDDDVALDRLVLFVDGARGLDYQPIFAVAPGYTAWSTEGWRRRRFGKPVDWGHHRSLHWQDLHWQDRQPLPSG